jgi:REP element-mobilizing transposase RayT
MDRFLDAARYGPTWLRDRRVAEIVVNALQHHQQVLKHCELHAFVVMANHVHVLTTPLVPPSKLLHSLKGFTARKANRALRRTGERFWQEESYDHWIRDEGEFARVRRYIEGNPVRAGLVSSPEEFPWSSARVQPA